MDQIKLMTSDYMRQLVGELQDTALLEKYRKPQPFPLDDGKLIPAPITPTENPPGLLCESEGSTKEEAENAIKIHRWLGDLSPVQAADARLWSTLTHTQFWVYTTLRWPGLKKKAENQTDYVLEHWFTRGGKAGLRRNAVSRLWWAAALTVRPWDRDRELECFRSPDPARFTKILLSNQQISFDLLERNFGSSLRIRICMLNALDSVDSGRVGMTDLSRESAKQLNCVARTRNLDAMPVPALGELCKGVVDRQADALTRD